MIQFIITIFFIINCVISIQFTLLPNQKHLFTSDINKHKNLILQAQFATTSPQTYFQIRVWVQDVILLDRMLQTKREVLKLLIPHPPEINQYDVYHIEVACHSHTSQILYQWNLVSIKFLNNFDHLLERHYELSKNATQNDYLKQIKSSSIIVQTISKQHRIFQDDRLIQQDKIENSLNQMSIRTFHCALLELLIILGCLIFQAYGFYNYLKKIKMVN